jgi:hypothetical protein
MAVFQSTFFVSLHSVGRFFSLEMPWLSGPRHCAQFELESEGFVLAGPEKPETTMQVSNE